MPSSLARVTFGHVELTGNKNLTETFSYDGLNRLSSANVAGQTAKTLSYDLLGNITNKSDVGAYSYGAGSAGPHAVTSAGGVTYSYDANGNNISSSDGRTISYTSFDQAESINKGSHTTTFAYGPDRSRYKRVDSNGSNIQTTLYIGSVEKITKADGSKDIKRHIGGLVIETESYANNGVATAEERHYTLKDHLGSMDVVTDASGQILTTGGELSFDAWGQRRNAVDWNSIDVAQIISNYGVFSSMAPITTRGFTGHEMVDDVGIIHMNGRIYDPKLARFLQADPFVQAPYDTQMLNRYSYVRNNPLNATDPSGYFIFTLGAIVWAAAQQTIQWYVAAAVFGAAAFADALVAGANLQDALLNGVVAAFTAGAANGLANSGGGLFGDLFGSELVGEAISMGLVGGIGSVLQGGKFGHGFVSAGVSASIGGSSWFQGLKSGGKIFTKAILGGTFSEITGGKFANGAATAAMFAAAGEAGNGLRNSSKGTAAKDINENHMVKNNRLAKKISQTRIVDENGKLIEVLTTGDIEIAMSFELEKFGPRVVSQMEDTMHGSYVDSNGVKHTLDLDFSLTDGHGDIFVSSGSGCGLDYACASLGGNFIEVENWGAFNDGNAMAHEFGHNLGFHHFNPGNNAFMSYDSNVSIQQKHIDLIERYYYNE